MARTHPRTVRDVMSTALQTVVGVDPIHRAARIMDRHGIRQLLVVDDGGRLVGLLSYRALLRVFSTLSPAELEELVPVERVMEPDPLTIGPDTALAHAVRILMRHGLSALPVVEEGRPVGVLSEHDIVRLTGAILEREGGP